jgi:hypothetical protein
MNIFLSRKAAKNFAKAYWKFKIVDILCSLALFLGAFA